MATTMQSEVGVLRRALLKHPRAAWTSGEEIDGQWETLDYLSRPDLPRAILEFDAFVGLLKSHQVEVELLPADSNTGLDSIYARDASIVCDRGVILCRMGKAARETEPDAQEAAFGSLGLPILGAIGGDGTLEGGDVTWLDAETLAVGRGYRTNDEGIGQLRSILGGDVEVIEVALPHWRGPGDVFHLMSILSPVDDNLALVYSPLMAVSFRELLLKRGIELVEVPDEEYDSMAGNVLTIAPRVCVQLSGNPVTRERLERAGVEVLTLEGAEISRKGCGGPTCLTRALERDA
ncbi:MAG: hypothetical protein IH855_08035 [Bacteroidetes bacterium]|nr:hypothetical protein [Bacteroidota bacterium]